MFHSVRNLEESLAGSGFVRMSYQGLPVREVTKTMTAAVFLVCIHVYRWRSEAEGGCLLPGVPISFSGTRSLSESGVCHSRLARLVVLPL